MAAFCICPDFASVLHKIHSEDCNKKYCSKDLGHGRGVPLLLIYFALLQGKFKRDVEGGRCSVGAFPKQKGLLDRKESVKAF